ncbi:alpha/beta-hydrolase [Serendipita vermifera]|nr:alpha/beta-hydrolase [Serendipita vermifera]
MPLLTIDQDLRFFYNIFSPKGSILDRSKPIILLLHPVFFDQAFFAPQYTDEALVERYNLILLDHHYHGGTQNTLDDEKYDFDKVVQDIFRFLDALEIEKCHLLGVAIGAVLAVRMAMLHVERVLTLTLCSMGPPAPTAEFIEQHTMLRDIALNKGDNTLEEIVRAGFKSLFGQKKVSDEDAQKWLSTTRFNSSNKPLLTKVYSALFDQTAPLESDWKRIKVPVLIAHGELDNPYPPSIARANYDLLSESTMCELEIIPNGPHFVTSSEAPIFNHIFVEFMQKILAA